MQSLDVYEGRSKHYEACSLLSLISKRVVYIPFHFLHVEVKETIIIKARCKAEAAIYAVTFVLFWPRKWFQKTMEELEKLSQREDAGQELTIYKTTMFHVTDEKTEV